MYTYIYTRTELFYIFHLGRSMPVLRNGSKPNKHQRSILERTFAEFRYINRSTIKQLALQTGLQKAQVSRWFSNKRRKKEKKQRKGTLSF